jgi:hypothetical protein
MPPTDRWACTLEICNVYVGADITREISRPGVSRNATFNHASILAIRSPEAILHSEPSSNRFPRTLFVSFPVAGLSSGRLGLWLSGRAANIGGMGRALGSLAHRQMLEYYVRPWRMPGRLCTRTKPFGRLPARSSATRVSGGFRWALCSDNAR